jgi:hypothetical protein
VRGSQSQDKGKRPAQKNSGWLGDADSPILAATSLLFIKTKYKPFIIVQIILNQALVTA